MKKKLVMLLMAAALTITACGGAAGDGDTQANGSSTETESQMATEAVDETETTEVAEATETTESESESTPADDGKDDKKDDKEDNDNKEDENTPSESEEPEAPAYTFTEMNKTMYCTYSCNIRSLPSTEGQKVGSLEFGTQVIVTGQCNETGWFRFEYNGKDAYVSGSYLSETAPAPEDPEDEDDDDNGGMIGEGESYTDEEGYIYYNWNGYIVKNSPRASSDVINFRKAICYADYYEIVMVGNSVGMKLPHGNDSIECFNRTMELDDYIKSLGYTPYGGGGGIFSENTDDYMLVRDFK